MKIAIISTSKRTISYPQNIIPTNCSEILTDSPLICKFAKSHAINCTELSLSDAVEKADYVIILCCKNSSKLPSITSKCRKFNKSFEIVMVE